ncbi:hypothetical protein DLB95_26370 [Salmonella enterica subsp. diarizonae]|uniref:Uncharacterized protein n=2 Tax=Salmonella enterica TaxID=28901 RepID=A0A403T4X5_SALER|nr:hypothetical protein [Salmonella enterica subsp. diarizonae]EBZ8404116.1 hypothetical protein [Salmonella enterica subsp. enterica serovar Muenchen]ECJ4380637.1 hypothetical protein [Salmonella enterica subsp. diarizonae]MMS78795.1 hypothetical protein [Salmonella enterica]
MLLTWIIYRLCSLHNNDFIFSCEQKTALLSLHIINAVVVSGKPVFYLMDKKYYILSFILSGA